MDPMHIAWVAGIIEGEGCISMHREAGWSVRVSMTDEDVIQRCHAFTGMGTLRMSEPRGSQTKRVYTWSVLDKRSVARLLMAIYPVLGRRRREAVSRLSEVLVSASFGLCTLCGRRYYRDTTCQVYCTTECRLADKLSKVKGTERGCAQCGMKFITTRQSHRFCSGTCRDRSNWRNRHAVS